MSAQILLLDGLKMALEEYWMLEPFVRRLEFLQALSRDNGVGQVVTDRLYAYRRSVDEFISKWGLTRKRQSSFWQAYQETYEQLGASLRALHRYKRHSPAMSELQRVLKPVEG